MRRDHPIVCLVTDRRRSSPEEGDAGAAVDGLLRQARHAVEAGIDLIEVRERDLEAQALAAVVTGICAIAAGSPTKVVVNDRLDVALAAGADGVHLRADSMSARAARRIVPSGFVIGRSVHGVAEAVDAAADVDYLIAGTIFPTSSKPDRHPLLGLDGLAKVARAVDVPVLAIGGVTLERIVGVASSGAAGVAAIGLFAGGPDRQSLGQVVAAVRSAFDTGKSAS